MKGVVFLSIIILAISVIPTDLIRPFLFPVTRQQICAAI